MRHVCDCAICQNCKLLGELNAPSFFRRLTKHWLNRINCGKPLKSLLRSECDWLSHMYEGVIHTFMCDIKSTFKERNCPCHTYECLTHISCEKSKAHSLRPKKASYGTGAKEDLFQSLSDKFSQPISPLTSLAHWGSFFWNSGPDSRHQFSQCFWVSFLIFRKVRFRTESAKTYHPKYPPEGSTFWRDGKGRNWLCHIYECVIRTFRIYECVFCHIYECVIRTFHVWHEKHNQGAQLPFLNFRV